MAISGGDPQNPDADQYYLFDQENYDGNWIGFAESIPILGTFNWNDRMLSFKVGTSTTLTLWGREKYQGVHITYTSSQASLPLGLQGKNLGVSSIQLNPSSPVTDSPPSELNPGGVVPPPNPNNTGGGNNLSPAPQAPPAGPAPASNSNSSSAASSLSVIFALVAPLLAALFFL